MFPDKKAVLGQIVWRDGWEASQGMYGPWGNDGLIVTFEVPVVSEVVEVC